MILSQRAARKLRDTLAGRFDLLLTCLAEKQTPANTSSKHVNEHNPNPTTWKESFHGPVFRSSHQKTLYFTTIDRRQTTDVVDFPNDKVKDLQKQFEQCLPTGIRALKLICEICFAPRLERKQAHKKMLRNTNRRSKQRVPCQPPGVSGWLRLGRGWVRRVGQALRLQKIPASRCIYENRVYVPAACGTNERSRAGTKCINPTRVPSVQRSIYVGETDQTAAR